MPISAAELLAWNITLAEILHGDHVEDTLQQLVPALEKLTNSSSSMVIIYPRDKKPFVPFHTLGASEPPSFHIDQYVNGPYLVDPYYRLALDQQAEGAFSIDKVAPEGFRDSEFYRVYYNRTNLVDEACFLVQLDDAIALVSLGRYMGASKYNREEQQCLDALYPVVKAVIKKWWYQQGTNVPNNDMPHHLETALAHFGESLLTGRECEVLNLMLRGHSSKSIADKLDISAETIKHHRKRIYAKLDVSTQAELFFLFIDSLRSFQSGGAPDPLISYLAPP